MRAVLADGTVLNFPDGTDPAVVQRVVKQHVAAKAPAEAAPKKSGLAAFGDAALHKVVDGLDPLLVSMDMLRSVKEIGTRLPGYKPPPAAPARPRPLTTGQDMAAGGGAGLLNGLSGISDAMHPVATLLNTAAGAGRAGQNVGRAILGQPAITSPVSHFRTGSDEAGSLGGNYQPQTRAGRYTKVLGTMAPNALMGPASLIRRAAQVVLPTIGSEGGREMASAAGLGPGGQQVASVVGALLGGGASSARLRATPRPSNPLTPAGVSPASAQRATSYIEKVARDITPADLQASTAHTAAEALGKSGEVAVAALARRTGATGDALAGHVGERQLGRPARLQGDVAHASGLDPETAFADIRTQAAAQRELAAPLYEHAYSQPPPQSAKLDALIKRPSVREAMGKAAKLAAEQDRDPMALGFEFNAAGDVTHVKTPSMETWDYIKQGLDDVLEGYRNTTTGKLDLTKQGRAVLNTLNELRGELTNPATDAGKAYRAALDAGGDPLRLEEAFRKAPDALFNGKLNEQQFAEMVGKLDQHGAQSGIANRWHDLLQTGKLDPKILKTPRVQAKLRIVFGREKADALIAAAEKETRMQAFERRAAPGNGSPTGELTAAMAEQDAGGGLVGDVMDRATKGQGLRAATTGALAQRAQGAAATLRTPGMPIAARDEAGRLLMGTPQELAAYLKVAPKNAPRLTGRAAQAAIARRGPALAAPAALAATGASRRRDNEQR